MLWLTSHESDGGRSGSDWGNSKINKLYTHLGRFQPSRPRGSTGSRRPLPPRSRRPAPATTSSRHRASRSSASPPIGPTSWSRCAGARPALVEGAEDPPTAPSTPADQHYQFRFPVAVDPDWHTLQRWWLDGHERSWTSERQLHHRLARSDPSRAPGRQVGARHRRRGSLAARGGRTRNGGGSAGRRRTVRPYPPASSLPTSVRPLLRITRVAGRAHGRAPDVRPRFGAAPRPDASRLRRRTAATAI
jgi:hypothetical protein